MPFQVNLEEGERLIANLTFMIPKDSAVFQVAVTDRAVFLPRKKFFAVKDPNYTERVPLNRIAEAKVKKLSPIFLWVLALLMVVGGAVFTALMLVPILRGEGGEFSGFPPAATIVGLVIPFIARQRYGLFISIVDETFLWKPRLHVDRASRNSLESFLTEVAEAFRQAGVSVIDERDHLLSDSTLKGGSYSYPVARPGDSSGGGGVLRACYHCGKALRVSRWEDWNGFLFRCPNCGEIYGKPWSPHWTLLASVLLNAFSFFLTMRWKRALPLFLGFALLGVIASVALNRGQLGETSKLVLLATFFLGPLTVNSVLLLRHEVALKTASVVRS
jgi:hypothetical protein